MTIIPTILVYQTKLNDFELGISLTRNKTKTNDWKFKITLIIIKTIIHFLWY